MPLKTVGTIAIPHAAGGAFDHGALHPKSRRVFIAHTARDCIEVIDEDNGSQLATTRFAAPGRWLALAAALFLMEVHDMSKHAVSFESNRTGVAPEGWTPTLTGTGDPQWTVESDATAPSRAKVIRQSGRATFPLLLKTDSRIKDGFVEVKFKALAGAQDRAAGVVWRASDANNYYVARANALEDNFVLYKTIAGVRSALEIVGRKGGYGVSVPVPAGTWHTLRVDFKGTRFIASFNGKPMFEVEDSTFTGAGMVGLWTKADSVTLFDEVSYEETK